MALMSEKEAAILKKHICEFYNMKSENEELRTMLSQCAADIQKIKRANELFGADPDKEYIHMEKIEKLLNNDYSYEFTNADYIWRKFQENEKLLKENRELKAILKQAVEDFEKTDCGAGCGVCVKGQDAKWCYNTGFEWKCAKQALKLLGEEYSDSDSAADGGKDENDS